MRKVGEPSLTKLAQAKKSYASCVYETVACETCGMELHVKRGVIRACRFQSTYKILCYRCRKKSKLEGFEAALAVAKRKLALKKAKRKQP